MEFIKVLTLIMIASKLGAGEAWLIAMSILAFLAALIDAARKG